MASIVDGHQVGVIVPVEELLDNQTVKWAALEHTPLYALANPFWDSEAKLIAAGQELIDRGADVLMLDCLASISGIVIYCKRRWMFRCCSLTS